ncbi:MAG: hypothetical protein AUJ52_15680 [Elusimicrobia bacterium CG1_02_63_36]|nr:MAG: hypothetical protein AUJ52_15680 [Elusimicrobia bacterium CG1_02_63_36]PIP82988.1 MAG: hypothetical protein COR54_11810 [Elusimicrobia bacterium CG22_combo_CG10-13_8_21_14_all_63_91]PJA17482.1 MAG: hypothetical protein COX66_04340 [Elusimicrobia bacterium CG_4_10_14_0_2_um_filter_63_34]PJB25446.1 MAG: hypothetical protein CO113_08620 [Elusimicrobia bacterium CG_4_9_14_3_um_filter_62_55]
MTQPAANGIELFYDFVDRPERAAATAASRPPVAFGVLAYCVGAGTLFLAQAISGGAWLGTTWFSLMMLCVWNLAFGILITALVHVFADGMGGRGGVIPMFVMLGYSELGWGLAVPASLIALALFPGSAWLRMATVSFVGVIVFSLKVRSIRLNYGFSRLQAALSLAAPYATLAAVAALGVGGMIWAFVSVITKAVA